MEVRYQRANASSIFILGSSRFGNTNQVDFDVIDLQNIALELVTLETPGKIIDGFDLCGKIAQQSGIDPVLSKAIRRDLIENQRNSTPLCGYLYAANGQSVTASVLLAMDAVVTSFVSEEKIKFEGWILLRSEAKNHLWRELELSSEGAVVYELISRTPGDIPELIVVLAKWKSGRTRLVVGSIGMEAPEMVFDGTEKSGIVDVAKNACSHLFKPPYNNYLSQTTITLLNRLLTS